MAASEQAVELAVLGTDPEPDDEESDSLLDRSLSSQQSEEMEETDAIHERGGRARGGFADLDMSHGLVGAISFFAGVTATLAIVALASLALPLSSTPVSPLSSIPISGTDMCTAMYGRVLRCACIQKCRSSLWTS